MFLGEYNWSLPKKHAPIHSKIHSDSFLSFQRMQSLGRRPHYAEGIWKRRLHSENGSDVFRPYYAGGIWKRRFRSENASDVFRPHYVEGILKRNAIAVYFGFVFEENSVREMAWLPWRNRFRKVPFSKRFPSKRKRNAGVFKFLRFEVRFRKAPFSRRISVDGRPNHRNPPFSNDADHGLWGRELTKMSLGRLRREVWTARKKRNGKRTRTVATALPFLVETWKFMPTEFVDALL